MVPPVPIPNTVVKHSYAESTCLETDWEDRALPVSDKHSEGVLFSYAKDLFPACSCCDTQGFCCIINFVFIIVKEAV